MGDETHETVKPFRRSPSRARVAAIIMRNALRCGMMWVMWFGLVEVSGEKMSPSSPYQRLCVDEGPIDDTTFSFPIDDTQEVSAADVWGQNERHVRSFVNERGETVSYAVQLSQQSAVSCVVVVAPSLSGHATHTVEWLGTLSLSTKCTIVVLEYRGFGLRKQRTSMHRVGMKVSVMASDFQDLLAKEGKQYDDIFLLGLSAGANVIWAWMQLYWTSETARHVRGILPLEGGLLAAPQSRAAASSFDVNASAFSWSALQAMTNRFLEASTPERCFHELYTFFTQPGFFSSRDLAETYLRATCDVDCVSFGLLNKDSLLADYTDVVIQNANHFRVPVFVFLAEGSLIPSATQKFVETFSMSIPGSVRWSLDASAGGVHFTLMSTERGHRPLTNAMSAFINSLQSHQDESYGRCDDD